MSLDAIKKRLLNLLGESQPALNDPNKPRATSNVNLGDIIDDISTLQDTAAADIVELQGNKEYTTEATYDFAVDGGAQGAIDLGVEIPAGAIVTRLVTRAETSLASAGLATVALGAGVAAFKAATAFDDASYVGLDFQTLAAPVLVAAAANLEFTIADADLTDGKMRIMVSYVMP